MDEEEEAAAAADAPPLAEAKPGEEGPSETEGDEEGDETEKKPKKKKKKGNWKNIGHEPLHYELHPCWHKWQALHPKGPCIQYKQVRWVLVPLSDRMVQLALPILRRLLALWLEFADKFPPEMRARLAGFLNKNYGLTEEFLEEILEEERIRKEEEAAGKGKGGKGGRGGGRGGRGRRGRGGRGKGRRGKKGRGRKGGKGRRGKGGKKGKKGRKGGKGKKGGKKGKGKKGRKGKKDKRGKKGKGKKGGKKGKGDKEESEGRRKKGKGDRGDGDEGGKKGKGGKKGSDNGLLFKKRKGGKLPLDWPYKMGSKFLLTCIAILSKDPDEDYNSRATEYFDVQAMAILEEVCQYMEMPLPDPEKPTQYGETLVIMALNLSDWIAKYVTTPAQAIPDDKVDEYLELRGVKPKPPKAKKEKKAEKDKKGKKKKGAKEEIKVEAPEPVTEVQRNWNELKSPVYVPEKSRVSKRKAVSAGEDEDEQKPADATDVGYQTDNDQESEGVPRWEEPTLDDIKKEFLEYINWYNPWEPEFMYFGPRRTPEGINMFKIWDPDSDEIPPDLRVLNWNQIDYGYVENYSFIPAPVPQYYPALRPLRPIRLEDLEKSGISRDIIKKNLRFYSPWYLMSKTIKPPPPPPPPEVERVTEALEELPGEFEMEDEEVIEDEMLVAKPPPAVKDSLWGDYKMKEQLELIGHILHMMASVPDLTIEYLFEMLEEFCDAVSCAEIDENPTDENKLLLKKRTIILEQYFLAFFGKKFRDYNERTPEYMRVLCMRCAYYIQLLYEYTARILWELQSRANLPTPLPTPPETPDDPEALRDWDDWLAWLLKVTKTCDEWAGWITETVNEAERKAAKKKHEFVGPDGKKVMLTPEEWYKWKAEVEQKVFEYRSAKREITKESPYYLEKAQQILPVKHRENPCKEAEISGEGEEEGEEAEESVTVWQGENDREESEEETEWEDVGEVEN